ncbi:MAG: dTDP-glucose pyrophosphorylase [Anaerolineales bacterium]|nr:dTDP-glucose pyrophosphorylase [Anaerolineales bacterium]
MGRIVGVVPAAGLSQRLAPLPSSKELFPIGFHAVEADGRVTWRPKPVGVYLLERMAQAQPDSLVMVINRDKLDILRYFGGRALGIPISYVVQENAWGMPFALALAHPWLGDDDTVLFGMPDTVFFPVDAFPCLLAAHNGARADLTLGLFPTSKPERFGMASFDQDRRLIYTIDKPAQTDLTYMWGIGCWNANFTNFMSNYLADLSSPSREVVLGQVFQAAVDGGLNVRVLPFEDGEYVDMGAPGDLLAAVRRFSAESS